MSIKEDEMKHDGGPAFPVADLSKTQCPGMSLRDWLAGLAMQGVLTNDELLHRVTSEDDDDMGARWCYSWADSMLRARDNG
jgi:hypothetical protein